MTEFNWQSRIDYKGNLKKLLIQVCEDYKIGKYLSHKIVAVGYEDFNLIFNTTQGKFFLKIFANFRDQKECQRYLEIMLAAIKAGVAFPKLCECTKGFMDEIVVDGSTIRFCLMEFIDGESFYQGKLKPTKSEIIFLVNQAALINSIKIKPSLLYDSWAIPNFLNEFKKVRKYLSVRDLELIFPLAKRVKEIPMNKLPHCFVHGDIIDTNLMKNKKGKLFVIDFAVANYYPRIIELAVLLCDLFFDKNNPESFLSNFNLALNTYQRHLPLTPEEVKILPLFIKLAHAMHIIAPTRQKYIEKFLTSENDYWLNLGRTGLRFANKLWP